MDPLSAGDRLAIHDVINLHGHLMDGGEFDRLGELLTDDVAYDVTALGGGVMRGLDPIREAGLALGDRNPLGHHVTNVVVTDHGRDGDGDWATAISKFIGVMTDGTSASGTYRDRLRRTAAGWRISQRAVVPRRRPLQP